MARVVHKEIVSLELTEYEAEALRELLGRISWGAQPSKLAVAFDEIWTALYDAGVDESEETAVIERDS